MVRWDAPNRTMSESSSTMPSREDMRAGTDANARPRLTNEG